MRMLACVVLVCLGCDRSEDAPQEPPTMRQAATTPAVAAPAPVAPPPVVTEVTPTELANSEWVVPASDFRAQTFTLPRASVLHV